jgi:UDP-glucose 4-epimerase
VTSWLVTGGAGYIGAHVVRALLDGGDEVVVLDDLSTGTRDRVPARAALVEGSVLDGELVGQVLREHAVAGVVHIAAKKQVGESVEKPLLYYRHNVEGTRTVLDAAVAAGVASFVFSSSASTYGMVDVPLVTEDMGGAPISPYGETKLVGEWMCRAAAATHPVRAMSLRYFNVAGAASPELGDPAVLNLIPMVFRELEEGRRPKVFGADYPTPDGTCIRDYVHVADIADAHVAALRHLASSSEPSSYAVYNIGRGEGSSVLDVLKVVGEVTGHDVTPDVVARRPGDPAAYAANVDRIRADLGWTARYDLHDMVSSAWAGWRLSHDR